MKVYRSNSDDQPQAKRKLGKKGIAAIAASAALLVAAVAITLTLTLGGGSVPPPIDVDPPVSNRPVFVLPVSEVETGKEFSNEKLVKYKTMKYWETHEAIDFLTEADAEVKAVSKGTVLSVDLATSMEGTVIKIQHENGLVSIYKGLRTDVTVAVDDTVKEGDVIGYVGVMTMESRDYDKAHLHLEMTLNGKLVNPLTYLPDIGPK